jgi:LysM repeat protein
VRVWTKSACVVLAWSILLILAVAAGLAGSASGQADTRTASITQVTLTGMPGAAAAPVAAATPAARYVVQPGDTLSGIAARFAVRGGWPALYAANRSLIGPDPDLIHPGTVLVLPGLKPPARYTVQAGDTLAGIAAALAVPGGWPALYAANRRSIGSDPGLIYPGTVLTVPAPAVPPALAPGPGRRPFPPSPAPAGDRHPPLPVATRAPAPAGMPSWLKTLLLAVGLFAGAGFLAEPILQISRRRRAAAPADTPASAAPTVPAVPAPRTPAAGPGQKPGPARPGGQQARIVLADYGRLVVTCSKRDDMVYVFRPPGADPGAILRVARLVLPEGPYEELAEHLGLPASWPVILADYDRTVVTCSERDGTVYVLRPPGTDPKAILQVARLVLAEGPYEELADHLGVPASWPIERQFRSPPEWP